MLRTRLYLGLLPLVLLVVAVGGYAIHVTQELAGALQDDLVRNYRDVLASEELRSSARLMTSALSVARSGDPFGARRVFDEHRRAFTRVLMAQSAGSAGTPRAPLIAQLDDAFSDLVTEGEALLAGNGRGSLDLLRRHDTALYRVLNAIENVNRADFAAAQETAARAGRMVATTQRVLAFAIGAAVVLSLTVAWRLAASLLAPIKALTVSAAAVGEGDLDRTVPAVSRDELGQLARSFNQMAAKLRAYRDATLAKVLRTQRAMEATLTSAPDPLFVIARDGTHEIRNPAAEQLFNSTELAGGFPAPIADALARVLETGAPHLPADYREVVTLRVGREDRHFLPRILAIGDTLTEFKGAAVVLQDVTKFRLLDDAKTNLVGMVSHELKTPLTSLRMAIYLLLERQVGALGPQQRELLEGARDDADRLLRILESLLDLARLEAGASSLARAPVAVSALLEGAAAEARGFLAAAGQTLEVRCAAEIGALPLEVDAGRLRHVFMNLLTNASKYSPPRGAIGLSARREAGGFVRFSVEDRGSGMLPEIAAHVFERFFRAPDQEKKGAGLGLAIAREIVVAHGGTIACTSEPGRGTEFYFLLPGGA